MKKLTCISHDEDGKEYRYQIGFGEGWDDELLTMDDLFSPEEVEVAEEFRALLEEYFGFEFGVSVTYDLWLTCNQFKLI